MFLIGVIVHWIAQWRAWLTTSWQDIRSQGGEGPPREAARARADEMHAALPIAPPAHQRRRARIIVGTERGRESHGAQPDRRRRHLPRNGATDKLLPHAKSSWESGMNAC